MSEWQTLSFEDILPLIEEPKDTLILFHRNPDADAAGSAFCLREVLGSLGSRAWCVCESELPTRLRFLSDGAQSSVIPASVPADFSVGRIVAVDTASPAQLGALAELYGGKIDLMIDHHGKGEPFAPCYVRPDAAATGEILFDLVKQLASDGRLTVTERICVDLYAAISSDTGGFRYSNTSPETHRRAADLLTFGIDSADINQKLFETKTVDQLRAQAAGISNLHLFADGKIAVITFPYALKVALGLADEHLEVLIDVARSLLGVKVAVSIRQPEAEGVFRVSTRSACDYDVGALCANFGGGGHRRAAGCTIHAADMEEALGMIVSAIDATKLL